MEFGKNKWVWRGSPAGDFLAAVGNLHGDRLKPFVMQMMRLLREYKYQQQLVQVWIHDVRHPRMLPHTKVYSVWEAVSLVDVTGAPHIHWLIFLGIYFLAYV